VRVITTASSLEGIRLLESLGARRPAVGARAMCYAVAAGRGGVPATRFRRLPVMRTFRVASLVVLTALMAGVGLDAVRPSQLPGERPQVVSPLGKSFFAKPDADGAIAKADTARAADPKNVDLLLASARARDVALQFSGSIELYTKVIGLAPADVRGYRFRGHRHISTRRFDLALADLEKAATLAPTSFDVLYHLGLARFLRGEFDLAATVYRRCLDAGAPAGTLPDGWRDCSTVARDDESRVAVSEWLYRSLRRAGRREDAARLLAGIADGLAIKENVAYYNGLLFYKGARTEAQVLPPEAFKENTGVTTGYGIASFYLAEGKRDQGCALLQRLVGDEAHWNAFGFIAAETELTRKGGPCPR
jgi:tetratricopeptide (TPR) repeat protein